MESAVFRAAYPLAEIDFACRDLPLRVRLQAFNPMIPCRVDDSSLPAAALRYRLRNPTADPVEAGIAFSLPNFIGADRSLTRRTATPSPTPTAPGATSTSGATATVCGASSCAPAAWPPTTRPGAPWR